MKLSDHEISELQRLFQKKFGHPLEHTHLSNNLWTIATWNELEAPYLRPENPSLLNELDSLWSEIANTDRNTTLQPNDAEMVLPSGVHLYTSEHEVDNILTNNGMNDMAKNRTAESSLGTSHIAVGNVGTGELVTDSALLGELARKAWSEKITVDQTERYAASFVRSDFGADPTLVEAGGFTAAAAGVLVFRVTYAAKVISTGQIMTAQVSVQHQNGVVA